MRVHLLYEARDFDFAASLPPGHEELTADLELTTLLEAMAAGDKFLSDVSQKVLLTCLDDPEAIRYRQRVLADCLAKPGVIREMYDIAVGALQDKRHLWGTYGGTYQSRCAIRAAEARSCGAGVGGDRVRRHERHP